MLHIPDELATASRARRQMRQTTLVRSVSLRGVGVHTNARTCLTLNPAPANTGIIFQRADHSQALRALWTNVVDTTLRTALGDTRGIAVGTIEHLLAACAGLGIDNLKVEIDAAELPAYDGSAVDFAEALIDAGVIELPHVRRMVCVLKPVRVQHGAAFAEFIPTGDGLTLDVAIDFADPVIGYQRKVLQIDPGTFRRELARARSFGFVRDLAPLQQRGLALGASLDNTVALLEDAVLNPEGLRFPDECVRHKMLDALGDIVLAGTPISGLFRSYRGGHALNVAAVRALMSDPAAFELEPASDGVNRGVTYWPRASEKAALFR
jgi:UDP-3-O-[3-hydroxymyristoyl] N-acetylglucosamine deacetylase